MMHDETKAKFLVLALLLLIWRSYFKVEHS